MSTIISKMESSPNFGVSDETVPVTGESLTSTNNPNSNTLTELRGSGSRHLDVVTVETSTNRSVIHTPTLNRSIEPDGDAAFALRGSTTSSDSNFSRRIRIDRHKNEKWYRINLELALPFLIAGVGMVFTGYLLEYYLTSPKMKNFKDLRELTILVTPLLGLKGNLEMTLAARLCTLVNLGNLNTCPKKLNSSLADLAVSQVQAIVVGCLASVLVIVLLALERGSEYDFLISNVFVICASSIVTASLASLFLGILMIGVVFGSEKCNINPDNISTPIAAASGDLVTLNILAWTSYFLYMYRDTLYWLPSAIVGFYVILLPFIGYYSYRNKHTRRTLIDCWFPLIAALGISTLAGMLFQFEDSKFVNLSLYQPVINGVGGNLVSIQYNRISTAYNRDGQLGKIPESSPNGPTRICLTPCDILFRLGKHSVTAWVLIGITIPGHAIFAAMTIGIARDHKLICYHYFIVLYLLVCVIQVGSLILMAHIFTNFLWKRKVDPDSYVIPLLTAVGDILGTIFLTIVFEMVYNGSCDGGRTISSAMLSSSTSTIGSSSMATMTPLVATSRTNSS